MLGYGGSLLRCGTLSGACLHALALLHGSQVLQLCDGAAAPGPLCAAALFISCVLVPPGSWCAACPNSPALSLCLKAFAKLPLHHALLLPEL